MPAADDNPRRRRARPERIRFSLWDDPAGATPIELPSRRGMRPAGLIFGIFFAIFAGVLWVQIAGMTGHNVRGVFDLMFVRGLDARGPEPGAWEALGGLFVPLWPALAALFTSHGVSFAVNFIARREYEGETVTGLMSAPYRRIIVMHLTIIFGGWILLALKSPVPALALSILLKLAVDLGAHRREHSVKTQEKRSNSRLTN